MSKTRPAPRLPCLFALPVLILLAFSHSAGAQMVFGKPYVAVFGGRARTDFRLGPGVQDLNWRNARAFELGFELLGITFSPGIMLVDRAEWTSGDENTTLELDYRTYYINIGARENVGIYFAGGLNWVQWDALPQESLSDPLKADSEIGFQAFLGFVYSFDPLPLKLLIEGGYMQVNGNVTSAPNYSIELTDLSSSGPVLRIGLAIGR
jgi:hypothetical protein